MKLQLQDLPQAEFAVIHDSVLRLLFEQGVMFENQRANEMLTRAGNEIDSSGRIHLKPAFVECTLERIPADGFLFYGRDEVKILQATVDHPAFRPSTGPPFIIDHRTRQRREATMDDARVMTTLADALDGFSMVNSVVNPGDAPGGLGSVLLFVNAHRYSLKPSDVTVMTGREVRAIGRIAAAIRGGRRALREKPLAAIDVAMITPLRCAGDQVDALLEAAAWGMPIELLSAPMMGVSAPVTISGSVTVALAELLAAICLVYQVAPGLGFVNTCRISPVNLRTGAYNYGAPELGMGSVVMAAAAARYHIPSDLYGFGTCAEQPGIQASMEKMLNGLLMALGRPYMITGGGVLQNALTTSPEQLVLDNEAIRFIRRITKPIPIDGDAIGLPLLSTIQAAGHLLGEEHTVKYTRAGEMLTTGLGQWSSTTDLRDRARDKVEQILATHHVEPFDPAAEREINRALEEF